MGVGLRREKHYIAVDKKRVMRCKWCGTTESDDWMDSYCSKTCSVADSLGDELCGAVIFPTLWISAVISLPTYDPQLLLLSDIVYTVEVVGALFVIIALCPLIISVSRVSAARRARKIVPRDSRRIDKVFDKRYLRCQNCGAPLEMMDGKTAMKCSYCGTINRTSYT